MKASMSSLSRKLLAAFAVLGLGASSAATYVHYNLIRNPDYTSFCDINTTVSCKAAYLSKYGSVAGVPMAVWGIIFFAWVLLMVWGARDRSAIADSAVGYIFAASTVGLAVVLYLAYASFFVLKEVCPLCVTTYVGVIGVFIVSGRASSVPLSSLPSRLRRDMRVLVATPLALVVSLLFIAGASWGMTAFPRETERPVAPQTPPLTAEQRAQFEQWWNMQPASANFPYANDGAKVLIVEFADFQCPHCRLMYFAYKPILDRYLAEHPKDVKFIFKSWPLSSRCNASVPGEHFTASCEAAAAYVLARPKGTAESLKDWFFLHQEELSPATVKRAAADIGQIADFDANYARAIEEVKTDAAVGSSLDVNSTPSFFVNGRRVPAGGVPAQYLRPPDRAGAAEGQIGLRSAIRTRELTKDFPVGFWRPRPYRALDRLSLEVAPGEVFGFLGPNGAGKTTTLKLLMQLVFPTSGEAEILGRPVGDIAVRRRLGYLPENPYFYDHLTAEELLDYYGRLFGMPSAERRSRIAGTLDRLGIGAERRLQLRKFSKGMLQRVGLAQAILNDPEVLFLDEPMSGLDPLGRRDVRALILELRDAGRTIFFSSHILSDAEALCSQVAIVAKGRLAASGRLADLQEFAVHGWELVMARVPADALDQVRSRVRRILTVAGDRYVIELPPEGRPEDMLRELTAAGATLVSLTPLRETLEDVFVRRVKEMGDGARPAADARPGGAA